jgi:hypothetical protein
MNEIAKVTPSHSVILVMVRLAGVIPSSMSGALVASTPSCVAVGILSEHDGETTITITDEDADLSVGLPVFDGVILTPSRVVSVCSALDDVLRVGSVPAETSRIRVFVNHPMEPDLITIRIS